MATGTIKKYVEVTDSDWQEWTNPSVFTGTIYYRRIGVFGVIAFTGIKFVSETSSGNIDLGTLPASYGMTPANLFTASARIYTGGTSNYTSVFTVYETGSHGAALRLYKDPSISTITTSATLHATAVYLLK